LQDFSKKFNKKLTIRYFLNENDEKKMKFENSIDQVLRFARLKNAILKIKQIEHKIKRSTIFVKKMKLILEKNVRDCSLNLLRVIKQREKFLSRINTQLNDFIKIMKKIIININNLINCVFIFRRTRKF
jgi:hypothetical protein